jgi:hypothetical protein
MAGFFAAAEKARPLHLVSHMAIMPLIDLLVTTCNGARPARRRTACGYFWY